MRSRLLAFLRRGRDRVRSAALVLPVLGRISGELARSAATGWRALRADLVRQSRPLRIGVDIRPFYEPLTGVGWYLWEVLRRLATRPDVELVAFGDARATDHGPALHIELPPAISHRTFDLRGGLDRPPAHTLTMAAFPLLMRFERLDVMFGGNYFLPRAMDAVACRRVVTVHDLTYRKHPELLQAETLANLEDAMTRELARADAVITVSHATRADLLESYDIDPRRVVAVQNGVHLEPARSSERTLDLPGQYLLFVSTIEPRKGLDTLIDAFERLKDEDGYSGELVVAGRIGWKAERTAERLRTSRWAAQIRHLDYVSRAALDEIYQRADIFVLPSLYEGFGFPVLEAMAHRVPVITTGISSLPEVGGDAALYFAPGNAHELAAAIRMLSASPELRARMIERGLERIRCFDWDRATAETLAVLRRVAKS